MDYNEKLNKVNSLKLALTKYEDSLSEVQLRKREIQKTQTPYKGRRETLMFHIFRLLGKKQNHFSDQRQYFVCSVLDKDLNFIITIENYILNKIEEIKKEIDSYFTDKVIQ